MPSDLYEFSQNIRVQTLEMIAKSKSSHIASCYSVIDILVVLYLKILKIDPKNPKNPLRDRCIISKGHAAAAVYAVLGKLGFFDKEELSTFCEKGSLFTGHLNHKIPGVEFSSGSLGHGLSVSCGVALAEARGNLGFKTYVILSDGELNEGSTWEAILFAGHHKLQNLTVIIDYNKMQSLGNTKEILHLGDLGQKLEAFNFEVIEVQGHDHKALEEAFNQKSNQMPKALIAHTIKGKGVSFMEDNLLWHYKNPEGTLLANAFDELRSSLCAVSLLTV